jgi:hypothetical protein
MQPPLAFRSDQLLIRIADRLNAPNTDETFRRLEPELQSVLARLYSGKPFELLRVGAPNELFALEVRSPDSSASVRDLSRAVGN